jgi:PadR family transcriptional regulator PadR
VDTNEKITKWESQVRKGVLDFVVLICLEHVESYGYDLMNKIRVIAEVEVAEGTIYPLLNRLAKEGLVTSRWVEQETGIPRKYYQISEQGRSALGGMRQVWRRLNHSLDRLTEES